MMAYMRFKDDIGMLKQASKLNADAEDGRMCITKSTLEIRFTQTYEIDKNW